MMLPHTAHSSTRSDRRRGARTLTEPRPVGKDVARTDEEAFYAAQDKGFAALRARNQGRSRRKL